MNQHNPFGVVASYVHADARLGSLVELRCESRAASLSHEVLTLAHDLAVQVAATNPLVLRREDVTPDMLTAVARWLTAEEIRAGRTEQFAQRVVAARMERYHEQACLLEQKFIKDASITIGGLLGARGELLKEQLSVVRFVRFATDDRGFAAGEPS